MDAFDKALRGVAAVGILIVCATFISAGGFGTLFEADDAKKLALDAVKGQFQELELEEKNGELVYEVDILSGDVEKEVTISQQGKILGVEEEEADVPITGNALERASQVALAYIGEGKVTDSEVGDEEGYYEIEITLDDGDEVDVHLDENFNVLSVEY